MHLLCQRGVARPERDEHVSMGQHAVASESACRTRNVAAAPARTARSSSGVNHVLSANTAAGDYSSSASD
jgi:hypothetical protein